MTHRCGDTSGDLGDRCLNCGCWGDTHPQASFGYDCVCTDFVNRYTLMTPEERRIDLLEREAKIGPYAD